MEQINVLGIKSPKTIQSWEDKFDCVYDEGDSALFVSKEEFVSDEDIDIKNFKFHYVIDCNTIWKDNQTTWYYILRMVISPKSLDKKFLSKVADFAGVDGEDVDIQDIVAYGGADVNFGSETSIGEELDYNIITNIANVFETMNSLRGFYLDKKWNPYLNGWDIIKHCVMGEDMFKKMG